LGLIEVLLGYKQGA